MSSDTPTDDKPNEIEISLDDADLELDKVEFDSSDLPLEFSVAGVIRDLDIALIDELKGKDLEPSAIRFRVLNSGE